MDLCHAKGPWCVSWSRTVGGACPELLFGLAGYLSNEKESAGEDVEVSGALCWCLAACRGSLCWGWVRSGNSF